MIRTEAEIIKSWNPNAGGGAHFPADPQVGSSILVEVHDFDTLRWCVGGVDTKVPPECVRLKRTIPDRCSGCRHWQRLYLYEVEFSWKNRRTGVTEKVVSRQESLSHYTYLYQSDKQAIQDMKVSSKIMIPTDAVAKVTGRTPLAIGKCRIDKFVYGDDSETPEDGMSYCDGEMYGASFSTGADFGCVHHEKQGED